MTTPSSTTVETTTTASATTTVAPTTTTEPELDKGDLDGWETIMIQVGGEGLEVALADEPAERAQGLMGVGDLGGLDGMLFAFAREAMPRFWMKNTLIALDIAFFEASGALVDVLTMEPCLADPCPSYVSSATFSWALETMVGTLGPLDLGTTLSIEE